MSLRGRCSWQASWASGDRGYQELCGAELEATCRKRPGGCHVLCGKGNLLHLRLKKNWHVTVFWWINIYFVFISVSLAQTAGRGWTLRSLSDLPVLHCLIWPRENPTASASAAATLLVSASRLTQLKPPPLGTSLVRRCIYTNMHHSSSKVTFLESDVENINCSWLQISHLLLARLSQPETRTHQSLCPGKHPEMPKSWWDTTLRVVWWAAMCLSHATTSLLRVPGNIILYFGFK